MVYLGSGRRWATVVRIQHPPHDDPKGTVLEGLVYDAISAPGFSRACYPPEIYSIIELSSFSLDIGKSFTLSVGDGRVGTLECTAAGWRAMI